MTPELSAIDLTRAAVQIDGRAICAAFEFAEPPGAADFEVTLTLRDTTTARCCAALRFRRSARRLELGYLADEGGRYDLRPASGGAMLRGRNLVISGVLPPPNVWHYGSRQMPAGEYLGWSVTTSYAPEKYGPAFGDWLPRYAPVREPIVRHRDGATVRPGTRP
jgi:hypothetical protein